MKKKETFRICPKCGDAFSTLLGKCVTCGYHYNADKK